jgi:hypothetical protein
MPASSIRICFQRHYEPEELLLSLQQATTAAVGTACLRHEMRLTPLLLLLSARASGKPRASVAEISSCC